MNESVDDAETGSCRACGSDRLVPTSGPWWMGHNLSRLLNVARCRDCRAYVSALSGKPVGPVLGRCLMWQMVAVTGVVALGCIGYSRGGSLALWFGVPCGMLVVISLIVSLRVVWKLHAPAQPSG